MDRIICIVGPTASGKTGLSVRLAQALQAEIVSCDSMQVYRGMDIGTAKVTPQQMQGIRHHMIDMVDPRTDYSVSQFVHQADLALQDILARGKYAVVTGGTGLYVDSLMAGRSFAPYPQTGKRQQLEQLVQEQGIGAVLEQLQRFDPQSAQRLHPSDTKRIIRAAEVYLETGKTITQHNLETQAIPPRYHPLWIGLDFTNREDLYRRINQRVELMMQEGLMQEVQALLNTGLPPKATALQAIGYKEALAALQGEITQQEAAQRIAKASRNYAKRQLTWFRKNREVHWIYQPAQPDCDQIFSQALQIVSVFDRP